MLTNICFDMDGTIANLYGVENWLERLEKKDFGVYADAAPMCDMEYTNTLLKDISEKGIEINVISWASKTATKEEIQKIAEVKKDWLNKYNFKCDNVYVVPYGADKTLYVRNALQGKALLFDDDKRVRETWDIGPTIDPTVIKIENILKKVLDKLFKV